MTTPANSTPTLALTTDKQVYNVGDPLQLTAVYSDETTEQVTLTVSSTLSDGNGAVLATSTTEVTVNTTEQDTLPVSASDSFGNPYSVVSNNAGQAVLSTTVGQPPAAAPASPPADTNVPAVPDTTDTPTP